VFKFLYTLSPGLNAKPHQGAKSLNVFANALIRQGLAATFVGICCAVSLSGQDKPRARRARGLAEMAPRDFSCEISEIACISYKTDLF
jgi:hypothetical protein